MPIFTPNNTTKLFLRACKEIQGEEHNFLRDGSLRNIRIVGYLNAEGRGIGYAGIFPQKFVLVMLCILMRKFSSSDPTGFGMAKNDLARWSSKAGCKLLFDALEALSDEFVKCSSAQDGPQVAFFHQALGPMGTNKQAALDRLFYAKIFHMKDEAKIAEAAAIQDIPVLSELEVGMCYEVLLRQLDCVEKLYALINLAKSIDSTMINAVSIRSAMMSYSNCIYPRGFLHAFIPAPMTKDAIDRLPGTAQDIMANRDTFIAQFGMPMKTVEIKETP